jgi:regulator of sigma D
MKAACFQRRASLQSVHNRANTATRKGTAGQIEARDRKATQEEYTRTRNGATWPKRTGTRWPESTWITPSRCSPTTAKMEYTRRDTPLCQRHGDTPVTQSWLAGNREHIHLACKHPKIQATRSAFATLVENAIKDLCQLIKTHLGEARFKQLTDTLNHTLRKTEQDSAQRMEQQCYTTHDQQTAATAEHGRQTDTRRIRTTADRNHLHAEATQGTNGNPGQHGTYSEILAISVIKHGHLHTQQRTPRCHRLGIPWNPPGC